MNQPFSKRQGYRGGGTPPPITIREDAPDELRAAVLQVAIESGMGPKELREIACQVLRKIPNSQNWSEYPNIWEEVQRLIGDCPWYRVYDIAEAIFTRLPNHHVSPEPTPAERFAEEINDVLVEQGVGWQMEEGRFVTRGSEAFELAVRSARERATDTGRTTAAGEISEALADLSRRPEPDLTGAMQHGMAALECLARDVTGDPKATLGEILRRYSNKLSIPKPLDDAVEKAWGYASEMGRHVREGRTPERADVELVVTISAALIAYLAQGESSE
jgi:hypothetical protein